MYLHEIYVLKGREPKRTLLGSYAEALCVLTGMALFVLFWDTTWFPKGAYLFKNQITVGQKKRWGKRLFVPN